MSWNISIAQYDKEVNLVAEQTVCRVKSYDAGIECLDRLEGLPVYMWHDKACELDNPYFAMIETDEYKTEYQKVIN